MIDLYSKVDAVRLCRNNGAQSIAHSQRGWQLRTPWIWYDTGSGPPAHAAKTYDGSYAMNGWLYKMAAGEIDQSGRDFHTISVRNQPYNFHPKRHSLWMVVGGPVALETDSPNPDLYHVSSGAGAPTIARCVTPGMAGTPLRRPAKISRQHRRFYRVQLRWNGRRTRRKCEAANALEILLAPQLGYDHCEPVTLTCLVGQWNR